MSSVLVETTVVKFKAKHLLILEAMPALLTFHSLLVDEQIFLLFQCRQGLRLLLHVSTDQRMNYELSRVSATLFATNTGGFCQFHATIEK